MKARYQDPRRIGERWLLQARLRLRSPAHLGGADPDATSDRPLLRSADGSLYLAATTLKGVLRQELDQPKDLLGAENDGDHQAYFLFEDARVRPGTPTELRDGVAIDPKLGIAEQGKKYDLELLPTGTTFDLTWELLLPRQDKPHADRLKAAFLRLAQALQRGIFLGARTRRGFGKAAVEGTWTWKRFNLEHPEGIRAWIAESEETAPERWRGASQSGDLVALAAALQVPLPAPTNGSWRRISLQLQIVGSLLIRSPSNGPADHGHLHAINGGPVLSGTSLAGALRARCLRIVRTLEVGDDLVEGLFGPRTIRSGGGRASRLRVEETSIQGGQTLRHSRVRIDPWTGGAAEHLLFTEEPWFGGSVQPVLWWQPPEEPQREQAERALLLLVLRDLASGALGLGGETSIGRGLFSPAGPDGRFGAFENVPLVLREGGLQGAATWAPDLKALQEWRRV